MQSVKKTVQELLDLADIKIDGNRPWDVQVHNEKLYARFLAGGSLALGEAYMDGWWDCEKLDEFFAKILQARLHRKLGVTTDLAWNYLLSVMRNQQNKVRSRKVGEQHYDAGNDLYKLMLDKRMNYSCGYWKNARNLDEAQEAKLEMICQKLKLEPRMTLLDIGCGWGGLSRYAAEKYGAKVVGLTISKEQAKLAQEICQNFDVEIRLQDYRDMKEKFDRVVSVGMFEHVGYKNYRKFMKVCENCLKDDGLFLLHTIGGNRSHTQTEPWLDKYIFPGGVIPSASQISKSFEGYFSLEDWHNFGTDYDKTLIVWHRNFNDNWDKIKDKYDERFRRMWNYYLLCCAGSFRARKNQLWQIVFSKISSAFDYESVR
jgi:cyclopropane-fatty-acyl-phospholipid synthase